MSQTVPAGVIPVGAYGTGWVCAAPSGQIISCTTSGSAFTNGTALPPVTVIATVTGTGVTAASVQNASTTRAWSGDANPAVVTVMTAGVVPSAPTGITLSPAIGPFDGGTAVTSGGSLNAVPTAVEIGTAAEQQSGTSVLLLPCPGAAAAGCFTIAGNQIAISSMPARPAAVNVTVTIVTLGVAGGAGYIYASKPATIATPGATSGVTSATVTWVAPAINGSALTSYIVTPYLNNVAQPPLNFDVSTTTRTITGLVPGSSWSYTVAAVNDFGTSVVSARSVTAIPYALPGPPSVTAVAAGSGAVTLTWNSPNTNGSPITGYVVTPYIGSVAQATQTLAGAVLSFTAVGLTPGTAYTFTVAAINAAGTGPQSARSFSATPNALPSLSFPAPPAGEVGVAYSRQLVVNPGTAPFAWSVSAGTLPAGLTLGASTGLLSGTPTVAGSFSFTARVLDASSQPATQAVTLIIAAQPAVTLATPDGEVGLAYSGQPTTTGGTGPFTWTLSAGSLPAGVSLAASTGLISGTPTVAGSSSFTVTATDAFNQAANRAVTLLVIPRPVVNATAPASGQESISYSNAFAVTGGLAPYVWRIAAGSIPPGLSLTTSTGTIAGTPTTAGSYAFTIAVIDGNGMGASRAVTVTVSPGPLVIVKTANVSSAAPNSVVAYTITVNNTGSVTRAGVALSDPLTGVLDDATYNADVSATSGTATYGSSTVSWTGDLVAGATATITYSVTTQAGGNKVLSDTVTSSTTGTNCAAASSDPRCSSTVTIPGLSIIKTSDVATTTPGSTVHFSIAIVNTGQTPYLGATVTDSLASTLDDAVYNSDAVAAAGTVSDADADADLDWRPRGRGQHDNYVLGDRRQSRYRRSVFGRRGRVHGRPKHVPERKPGSPMFGRCHRSGSGPFGSHRRGQQHDDTG
jgi:uncharacterized repeat protein (TIGR01451 family)